MSDPTREQATPDGLMLPTRSPCKLASDEGPQSIGELKTALAPWPDLLAQFAIELDGAPFHREGEEPLRADGGSRSSGSGIQERGSLAPLVAAGSSSRNEVALSLTLSGILKFPSATAWSTGMLR
ncbi:hypothetical protein [Streptomyces sp. NPDC059256]|uniref:hypothetical protein n=1 Tax=Streptomyces sp. NPDC059256 TaxID=3346794 RepID=UPI0036A65034